MRVDQNKSVDILRRNIDLEIKESDTVGDLSRPKAKQIPQMETSYGVTATNVEKTLFSMESEFDKIQQDASMLDPDVIRKQMAMLSHTMTKEAAEQMEEEGFSMNDTDADTMVTVMDRIKMQLAKAGKDISIFGDDLSMDQLQAITGDAAQAMQMASSLENCQEGDIAYLVQNQLEPTIENLYMAQHSGNRQGNQNMQQPPQDANLQKQIAAIIAEAGLENNDTTQGYVNLLLKHEIPLTPENLAYVDTLSNLQLPLEEQQIGQAMAEAVAEGNTPKEAYLAEGYSHKDRAIFAQEVVENVTDAQIQRVIYLKRSITIESFSFVMKESQQKGQNLDQKFVEDVSPEDLRLITARRQLEEVRLVMTANANYRLLKQGISIETLELQELVEELRNVENAYYKDLLKQSGIDDTPDAVDLLKNTTETVAAVKELPAYVLGRYHLEVTSLTEIYQGGTEVKTTMVQANMAYETMMTVPRKDLGDSIQKAFQNVGDILQDLEMETSPSNERAVRILAYNQMEITETSILEMKAADEKMQNLLGNLKPRVVLEMIRQGINPLETDIVTLNQKAEEIAKELDPGREEKYSEFLWQLEQHHEITKEEKESYIGIYRLLHQIQQTDGAVIGAVVNQGGELSLKNLLSAVRTKRAGGMDITIDQQFGGTEEIYHSKNSISDQINASYQTDCAKEAFQKMTPEALFQSGQAGDLQDLTPEQLLWQMKQQEASPEAEQSRYQQQMAMLSETENVEDAVLKMLQKYELPMDTYHMMAMGQMVNNRNGVFRKLFQSELLEKRPDLQEAKQILLEQFAEAVKTPEDMAEAQMALAETAEHVMEGMIQETDLTSMDVRDLKLMRTQIEIGTKMSKEETYAIPVLIADEMTNVQLKIVRGKKKKGMVDILFDTEKLGKVAARIRVSQDKIQGFIVSNQEETLQKLKEKTQEFTEKIREKEDQSIRFDFMREETLSLSEFSSVSFRSQGEEDPQDYQIQTKQLYTLAKEFLEMVKA